MSLPVVPDERDRAAREAAIADARDGAPARELLRRAIGALQDPLDEARWIAEARSDGQSASPSDQFWEALDGAYAALDAYLAHLVEAAGLQLTCRASCSACCADAPPTFAVEGIRMLRSMRKSPRYQPRVQLAVGYARDFQKRLVAKTGQRAGLDLSSPEYRQTQLEWRAEMKPCPALGDDGRCTVYAVRPLACRRHYSVEDPAHCEPRSPRFFEAEHPPVWSHPREAEFEQRLMEIGHLLGLPPTPNLPWALAQLHTHPLAKG